MKRFIIAIFLRVVLTAFLASCGDIGLPGKPIGQPDPQAEPVSGKEVVQTFVLPLKQFPSLGAPLEPVLGLPLPSDIPAYNPPTDLVDVEAISSAPQIAEWTKNAGPGESLALTGMNFSKEMGNAFASDTRFLALSSKDTVATFKDAAIHVLKENSAVITLPQDLSPQAAYLIWAVNRDGVSKPIAVNKTEGWWVGPNKATTGSTVSVFGRNLASQQTAFKCWVYLKRVGASQGIWVTPTSVNPYRVSFIMPEAKAGNYQVWVHNGALGRWGWSEALGFNISPPAASAATKAVNVKRYGAVGDGITDDEAAIQRAIDESKRLGINRVYFPEGVYSVSRGLTVSSNLTISGAGKDLTIIRANDNYRVTPPEYDPRRYSLIFGGGENIEISDLTLDGAGKLLGHLNNVVYMRFSKDVHFTNLKIIAGHTAQEQSVDVHGGERILFKNTEITLSTPVFLGTGSQVFFDFCKFYVRYDAGMAILNWGVDGLSLTNSIVRDYNSNDPTGVGIGRVYTAQTLWDSNRNTYIGNNQMIGMAPRPEAIDQNQGEIIMWEGGGVTTTGNAQSATTSAVTVDTDLSSVKAGMEATIVSGRGVGQHRKIIAIAGNTLSLERSWRILPDMSSRINIARVSDRIAIYSNSISGKERVVYSDTHVASAGVQTFSGVTDLHVEKNIISMVRTGLSVWGLGSNIPGMITSPTMFTLFSQNQISSVREGLASTSGWSEFTNEDAGVPLHSNIFRKNTITNILKRGVFVSSVLWFAPGLQMSNQVYEQNYFSGAEQGTEIYHQYDFANSPPINLSDFLFLKNTFHKKSEDDRHPPTMPCFSIRESHKGIFHGNSCEGYSSVFASIPADPVQAKLGLPLRMKSLRLGKVRSQTLSFPILNTGGRPLDWTASTLTEWITLPSRSGTVGDQSIIGSVPVEIHAEGMSDGIYTGYITLSGSGAAVTLSVEMTVLSDRTTR